MYTIKNTKIIWVLAALFLLLPNASQAQRRGRGRSNASVQRARQQQQAWQRQQQAWARQQQAWEAQQRKLEQQMQREWETKGRAEWQQSTLDELDRMVELTAEQKAKARPIIAEELKQLEAATKQNTSSSQRQARIKEIYATAWDNVEFLLTPRQKQKLDETGQDKILDRLEKAVGLSKDQKEKIRLLLYDEVQQVYGVRNDKKLTQDEKDDAREDVNRSMWEKAEILLTPDQLKKLNAARRAQALAGMRRTLVLSGTQSDKIAALMEDAAQKIEALRQDSLLTEEQATARDHEITNQMWEKAAVFLSPWQRSKLNSLRGIDAPSQEPAAGDASAFTVPKDAVDDSRAKP